MGVLKTNRRVLMWLCVWPPSLEISMWKKVGYTIFALIVFGFALIPILFDIYLLRMSMRTDELETCFLAVYQLSVSANTAYACVLIFVLRAKINDVFEKLTELYDTRKAFVQFIILIKWDFFYFRN